MASLQPVFLLNPPFLSPPSSPLSKFLISSPLSFLKPYKPTYLHAAPSSAPGPLPEAEKAMLDAVADSDGDSLPCVRSYEGDLARLTAVGAVDFEQALTAAAADGGEAASQHLSSGMDAMVVETVFPGSSDDHSTVSTRLFLPARKVKEKAGKLRNYITEDVLSSTNSTNILAMTFRQVVMRRLWSFELLTLVPGSRRNMEDVGSIREVPASFALGSTDDRIVYVLAEAICLLALEGAKKSFYDGPSGNGSNGFMGWALRTRRFKSRDSSVAVYRFEDEVVENAKSLLEKFKSEGGSWRASMKGKPRTPWWSSTMQTKLERIGGPEFSAWTSEYIPAYRLEIDAGRIGDLKFEGWKRSAENRWEVLLTHSQMVGLANILDLYLGDPYTVPDKQLSCSVVENPKKLAKTKRGSSLLRIFSKALASAIFLVSLNVLGQLYLPRLYGRERNPGEMGLVAAAETSDTQPLSLDSSEVDSYCIKIIGKIKDSHSWEGDIKSEPGVGAWIGDLPACLLRKRESNDLNDEDASTSSTASAESDEEFRSVAEITGSYQVVLSSDGRVIGFQPMSRFAVNNWAANPLAKELYGGKKLSPGLWEPGLKMSKPSEVVVLELLMSPNFAFARPPLR